jgi:hypothetical protein
MIGEWIKSAELLPDPYTLVLGWNETGEQYLLVALSDIGKWFSSSLLDLDAEDEITHWTLIPDPPNSDAD